MRRTERADEPRHRPPSSTSRPTRCPTWSPTRTPGLRGDRQRDRLRHGRGPHRHRPRRPDRSRTSARAGLRSQWILETHVHADHLSAAPYLRDVLGGRIGIGERITTVQHTFAEIYNAERGFPRDGSQFDHLFEDGERFAIGALEAEYLATPGAHPGLRLLQGRRQHLRRRHAVHARLRHGALRLPRRRRADHVPLDPAHPRPTSRRPCSGSATTTRRPGRDEFAWRTTVGRPARAEPAGAATASARTSSWRCARRSDATLGTPQLLIPSIQVNMRAGNCHRPRTTAPATSRCRSTLSAGRNASVAPRKRRCLRPAAAS